MRDKEFLGCAQQRGNECKAVVSVLVKWPFERPTPLAEQLRSGLTLSSADNANLLLLSAMKTSQILHPPPATISKCLIPKCS